MHEISTEWLQSTFAIYLDRKKMTSIFHMENNAKQFYKSVRVRVCVIRLS